MNDDDLSEEPQSIDLTRTEPVRVALLGCGTVGGGVLRLLRENRHALAQKVGAPLVVVKVLVRDLKKARVSECDTSWLTDDPEDIFGDESLDVVLELMGGEHPAKDYIERAIARGLTVVTANKLLMATYGPSLLRLAGRRGVDLAFEASVGGGVPHLAGGVHRRLGRVYLRDPQWHLQLYPDPHASDWH